MSAVAAVGVAPRGRTRVTARALQQIVCAVAGDALGVPAKRVDAVLTDHAGALDVVARAPITLVPIARYQATPDSLARSGGSLLERCAAAEQQIRDRVQALTGYSIRAVTLRIADVHVEQERRVR